MNRRKFLIGAGTVAATAVMIPQAVAQYVTPGADKLRDISPPVWQNMIPESNTSLRFLATKIYQSMLGNRNDDTTRAALRYTVDAFMGVEVANRKYYDYNVVCDERNNTPEIISRCGFEFDLYMKIDRSVQFQRMTVNERVAILSST